MKDIHNDTSTEDSDLSSSDDSFLNTPIAKQHSFYLTGRIDGPEKYHKWFNTIRTAGINDRIVLHINSYGGDLHTAIQFMRVISECRAHVISSVEGACMSAATMVFLAADSHQISEHSLFMFHNYSSFSMGKGGELYDNIVFERKWSKELLKGAYKYFLSKNEIADILNNRDIWMSSEEVLIRLNKRSAKLKKKFEKTENAK